MGAEALIYVHATGATHLLGVQSAALLEVMATRRDRCASALGWLQLATEQDGESAPITRVEVEGIEQLLGELEALGLTQSVDAGAAG